jgi:Lrp/AsnC family leucine-responsive transcriptional regulator
MPQARLRVERVIKGQDGTAGIAENGVNPHLQQGVNEDLCGIRERRLARTRVGTGRRPKVATVEGVCGGQLAHVRHATTLRCETRNRLPNIGHFSYNSEKSSDLTKIIRMELDKFDRAILEALQQDARLSLQELGKRVGLTASPCWTRIKRMEDAGVIEGYAVRVNPDKVGLSETVILHVTLDSHSDEALFEFGKALAEIPEVLEAYLVSGDYDYDIRVAVDGTRGYERFLRERLYKIPGIRHSKSSFVLRRLKQGQLPIRG